MIDLKETGFYKIRKEQIGIAGTKRDVEDFRNYVDCVNRFNNIERKEGYMYYCLKEVVNVDSDGKIIENTAPQWINING
jgi:hypothetical protein